MKKLGVQAPSSFHSMFMEEIISFTIEFILFWLLAVFRVSNPKNQQGLLNLCRIFLLRLACFIILFYDFTLRSSASGGLKPFSEEKGFKTSKKTLRLRVLDYSSAKTPTPAQKAALSSGLSYFLKSLSLSFSRISTRRIFPLIVFGSSFTNSTTLGYL